jgi:4-amino-4-deoxy-L-arabinose transferase-like glycosyltransferase
LALASASGIAASKAVHAARIERIVRAASPSADTSASEPDGPTSERSEDLRTHVGRGPTPESGSDALATRPDAVRRFESAPLHEAADGAASDAVPRWASRALVVSCTLAIAFLLLQLIWFGYGRDQGIYAMVARAVLDGKMPYRDAWDFKPPGIFLVYALARGMFGAREEGIRLLEALGMAATVLGMTRLAGRWWGEPRVGLLAGALAVLVHVQLDFWHTAQPESFAGMLTIAALLLAGHGEPELGDGARASGSSPARSALARWARPLAWAASGALFGLAGLLKPPLAGGGAVVAAALAFWHWRRAHGQAWSTRIARAAAPVWVIGVGGALPIGACLLWFAYKGALSDLWQVLFVFTPHYTRIGWIGASLPSMIWWGVTEWLTAYSSLLAAGLAVLLAMRPRRSERAGTAILLGVIAVHVAGVIMQCKFFPYHYGATWPLTALLAALGLWRVWEIAARRGGAGVAAFAIVLVAVAFLRSATKDLGDSFLERCGKRLAVIAAGGRDLAARDELASVADVNAAANRQVAEVLRARTPSDRSVFVWGFEPVIYDLCDRRPATRFLYDVPQRVAWAKEPMRRQLMDDLRADPPAAIVVEHRDVFPMVTGDFLDSATSLRDFGELRDLVHARYALAMVIEDFDVYLEEPAGAATVSFGPPETNDRAR